MAPPGTKAIIYKDSDTRALWAGYLAPPNTTIGVTFTMSPKQEDTESQDPLTVPSALLGPFIFANYPCQ